MSDRTSLAAIIVNHQRGDDVRAQLLAHVNDSPERFARTQWIVLHNSSDPSPRVDDIGPAVEVHVRPNHGYGSAINQAAELTDARYLLLLNADLYPAPGFLELLHERIDDIEFETADRIGIIGFRLTNADGTPQGSVGKFPTLWRLVTGLLRSRAARKYIPVPRDRPTEVPWVTGACVLVRRECFDALGGFDTRFFMYYEDVDLCRRAWQTDWKVFFDPAPACQHFFPYHGRRLDHRMVYQARGGMLYYFWKHRPRFEFYLADLLVMAECTWRSWTTRSALDQERWTTIRRMAWQLLANPREPRFVPNPFE